MSMLRRFEIYSLAADAPSDRVAAMDTAMRDAQRFIPEVLHSAVGYDRSPAGLDFVWEHAYESPAAYQRYMVHPFHANIYDRYLLNDSPERIVTDNSYDVGLIGYSCDAPDYFLPAGAARRLVLLRLKEGMVPAFEAIAQKAQAGDPAMILSVVAENTFGTRWLDGVTQILDDTTFHLIWEQGFATLADAEAASNDWRDEAGDMIETVLELWYQIKAGECYGNDAPAARQGG